MNRTSLRRIAAGTVLAAVLGSSAFVTTAAYAKNGADDTVASSPRHGGRHHEAGDDHGRHGGRHHEAGDDHGRHGGRHHEAGDDHGRHGAGHH